MLSEVFQSSCSSPKTSGSVSRSEIFTTSALSTDSYTNVFGFFILTGFLYFYKRTINCLFIIQQNPISYLVQKFVKVIEFIVSFFKLAGFFVIIRMFWIIHFYVAYLGKFIAKYLIKILGLIQDRCGSAQMNEGMLQRDNEISFQTQEVIHPMNIAVAENEFDKHTSIDESDGKTVTQKLELLNFLYSEDCEFMDSNINVGPLEVCNIASEEGNKSNLYYSESLCPGLAILSDKNRECFQNSTACLEQENKAKGTNELDRNVLEQEKINSLEIIKANQSAECSRDLPASPSGIGPPKVINASEGMVKSNKDKIEPFSEFQNPSINYNEFKTLIELGQISPNENESKITVQEQTHEFKKCELIPKGSNQSESCDTQNKDNLINEFVHGCERTATDEKLDMLVKNIVSDKLIQEFERCLPEQNKILLKQSNVLQTKCISKEKITDRTLKTHNHSKCIAKPSVPINEDYRTQSSRLNENLEDVVNRIDLRFIYTLS